MPATLTDRPSRSSEREETITLDERPVHDDRRQVFTDRPGRSSYDPVFFNPNLSDYQRTSTTDRPSRSSVTSAYELLDAFRSRVAADARALEDARRQVFTDRPGRSSYDPVAAADIAYLEARSAYMRAPGSRTYETMDAARIALEEVGGAITPRYGNPFALFQSGGLSLS